MKSIEFTWDEAKAKSNLIKHKVSFEEAVNAFFDPFSRVIPDPDHSEMEERFILLGLSGLSKMLTVVHCYRDSDSAIRIISARESTNREKAQYKEFLS